MLLFFGGFLVTAISDFLVGSSIELEGTCLFNGPWGSGKQSQFPSHLKYLNRSINNHYFKIKHALKEKISSKKVREWPPKREIRECFLSRQFPVIQYAIFP